MPNRILKESICTNDQIDELSLFEEVFFYRLIVNADDYGRYDGRIPVLKARLFPLRGDKIKDSDIEKALVALVQTGLLERYRVKGRPYIRLTGWERNQQIRAKKSKHPSPEDADPEEMPTNEIIGNHLPSNDGKCGEEPTPDIKPSQAQAEPAVIDLPLNDGTLHSVTESDIRKYMELYPAVDVMQELRSMLGWLDSNPAKRKTRSGVRRFINSWLSREQDRGRNVTLSQLPQSKHVPDEGYCEGNPFRR